MVTLYNMAVNQLPLLWQVGIKELEDGRILVRRKKVQPSELVGLARQKLLQAIECTCIAQNLTWEEEKAVKLSTADFKSLVSMNIADMGGGRAISPCKDPANFERRASEYLTEALAIYEFIIGRETFQHEFSNYLLGK